MTGRRVGDLNGVWAVLLRFTLVAIPVMAGAAIPFVKWTTQSCYTANQTAQLVDNLVDEIRAIKNDIAHMPPEEWRERIKLLECDSRQNLADHTSIKLSLEQIKAKLGVQQPPGIATN